MIFILIALGLAAGYAAGRTASPPPPPAGTQIHLAIRGLTDRAREPKPLADLIEAARTRAMRLVIRPDGYDVLDQLSDATLRVRAPDPHAVTPSTLVLSTTTSLALPFTVALALVDVFGPLELEMDRETYEIDGTRDQHALTREVSARLTARARALLGR